MEKETNTATVEKASISDELSPDVVAVTPTVTVAQAPQVQVQPQVVVRGPAFKITFPHEEKKYIKLLVYGDYGVGKTHFAGTAQDVPEMKNVMNIDAEGGNKVLSARGDIPSIKVIKYRELSAIFEYLKDHCLFRDSNNVDMLKASEAHYRGVAVSEVTKPKIYNTVIIDSISEVARYCMYDLLGIDIETVRLDDILNTPEYKEWNLLMESMRLLIRKFRNLPMNVIFVASRDWHKDEQSRQLFTPNIQGKLSNEIQGFMDHVGYYTMEKNESNETHRYLLLQPGKTWQAKNRFSNFTGSFLADPIMQDIYDLEVLNKSVPSRKLN